MSENLLQDLLGHTLSDTLTTVNPPRQILFKTRKIFLFSACYVVPKSSFGSGCNGKGELGGGMAAGTGGGTEAKRGWRRTGFDGESYRTDPGCPGAVRLAVSKGRRPALPPVLMRAARMRAASGEGSPRFSLAARPRTASGGGGAGPHRIGAGARSAQGQVHVARVGLREAGSGERPGFTGARS